MNAFNVISFLIENPKSIKAYKNFKKYFEVNNMAYEAQAIQHLMEKRFANSSSTDEGQRENNQ